MNRSVLFATAAIACCAVAQAKDKPVDFWDEAFRVIASAPQGKHVDYALDSLRRQAHGYRFRPKQFKLDHTDHQVGDFSVIYYPGKAKGTDKVGFIGNLWNGKWDLTQDMALAFHLKTAGTGNPAQWTAVLVDVPGKTARATLGGTDTQGAWKELKLPVKSFTAEDGFDWSAVRLVEFEAALGADSELRFDGVRFEGPARTIGVTDKTVTQRMQEAEENREFRVMEGYRLNGPHGSRKPLVAFRMMYLNQDLEKANQILLDHIKSVMISDTESNNVWCLITTQAYCRLYFMFSNRVGKFPGRMKPEVEKKLLHAIWVRTYEKNDIHWARKSTWWMDGSHNHDLNAKVANLLSSRIFMNEPDYKDRIYPDYGFGGAYHYSNTGYIGDLPDAKLRFKAGGGRANLKDGKKYNAADHYKVWVKFFKEYFSERAKRGFFLEANAGYMTYTMCFVESVYQLSGDEELHQVMDNFLTLFWAEWAQRQISGVQGGTKVRLKGLSAYNRMTPMGAWLLGGAGTSSANGYWNMPSDYRLPKIVWQMALDREGMGEYAFISRGVGEEENIHPRPAGAERSLLCDTDSRFVKYCYVTPDYTLGLQMDHPDAIHSHLSITDRWQGMTFAQSPDSMIVFRMYPESARELPDNKKRSKGGNKGMKNLQHKNVQIIQVARSYHRINPEWFPAKSTLNEAPQVVAFYVGSDWDEKVEKNGWIFLRKANAYAALRPMLWDKEVEMNKQRSSVSAIGPLKNASVKATVKTVTPHKKPYTWSTNKNYIELIDRYSPVILQAGRKANDGSFDAFMKKIMSNPINLHETVVPGYNTLVYHPFGAKSESLVFNCANNEIPRIDGKNLDYEYPMTFDSPYLKSNYKSGKVKIQYGDEVLKLDFAEKP
jgi:hypothetical protein